MINTDIDTTMHSKPIVCTQTDTPYKVELMLFFMVWHEAYSKKMTKFHLLQ